MTEKRCISICHGQNCRDVGGKDLTDTLHTMGIHARPIACQSLCSYAPIAKVNSIAILKAKLDDLIA
jgi:NADH:ubiquinone oxidoreductase subunit E